MPSDPSGLPREYKLTYLDRTGPDGALLLRALGYASVGFLAFLLLFAALAKKTGFSPLLILPFTLAATGVVVIAGLRLARAAGAGFAAFIAPSGNSTPSEPDFSREDALAAKGDIQGALASYEAAIAGLPLTALGGIDARIRAAELYARQGGDSARAVQLLREVQRDAATLASHDVYVSYRLMDLYSGVLGEPRRALVELRRLVERYPGTDIAARARGAITSLKRELEGDSSPR